MTLPDVIRLSALLLLAQSAILAAIFFISGQLTPAFLAPVYAVFKTSLVRTVLMAATVFPLGNWMMAMAFSSFPPAVVTPLNLSVIVLVMIGFTVLATGVKPSLWIYPAALTVAAACAWVGYLLSAR